MSRHALRRSLVAAVAAAMLHSPPVLAAAPADEPVELEDGDWIAIGTAAGVATSTAGGGTFRFTTNLDAVFDLVVQGGTSSGTWEFTAPVRMVGSGSTGGQTVALDWTGAITGGGAVSGTARLLGLTGDQHATGVATVSAQGQTFAQPIDNRTAMPPLEVVVVEASCVDAYGDWVVSLTAAAAEEAWAADIDGSWVALREHGEEDPAAAIAALEDAIREVSDGVNAAGAGEGLVAPEPGEVAFPVEWDQLVGWVDRTVELTNRVRNLTRCERSEVSAGRVEQYFSVLIGTMQNLIVLADTFVLDPADIRMLMTAGTSVGAVGGGSPSPERAAVIEEILRSQGERIANENVDVSGDTSTADGETCDSATPCVIVSYDMVDVLVTGAQYGWDYTIHERTRTAVEWLERLGDAPANLPDQGQG